MVTLFITTLAIIGVIGIGVYFWQRPKPDSSEHVLPPHPEARGLFAGDASTAEEQTEQLTIEAARQAELLLVRARQGERSVLTDARRTEDAGLYDRVLSELLQQADSDPKLLALMSYITQNELPVNDKLAQAVIASWLRSPDRAGTAKALHFAAMSDNAEIYRAAVESALKLWRAGKLNDVSPPELRALFDGEYWLMSFGARGSGAGFLLKQTLTGARRELEAAMRANQRNTNSSSLTSSQMK